MQHSERVCDLYAAALKRNRDEFEAGGSPLAPGCKQETARRNRPISLQPFGTVALRAVCGVANPRNSAAIAAVLRLASHPEKPLSRREEIANTFLQAQRKKRRKSCGVFLWKLAKLLSGSRIQCIQWSKAIH